MNKEQLHISYRDDTIWFSGSHAPCGAVGIMFWIKTTLYLYMCQKYGPMEPPTDLKLPE